MPNEELVTWQSSLAPLHDHDELSCASCCGKLHSPVALRTCGHLLCSGCADDLLSTSTDARDTEWREAVGMRFSGHRAFPPACLSSDVHTARAAKAAAREHLVELVYRTLCGRVPRDDIDLEVSAPPDRACWASDCP